MRQKVSGKARRSTTWRALALVVTLGTLGTITASASASATDQLDHHRKNGYRQLDLVSDIPGRASVTDPNLVNPWGLSIRHNALWVSDNGSDKATTYTNATPGRPVEVLDKVVSIPGAGAPTGNVRNDTGDFRFHGFGRTAAARMIFAGEDGDLFAWSPRVSRTQAVQVAHTETDGVDAVYKGLTLTKPDGMKTERGGHRGPELLVANFRDARIDVFNKDFELEPPRGRFSDPRIPSGFAPFNVKVVGSRVFVTYAKQDADKHDDVPGPGNGFVNVFDRQGRFLERFASRGVLNSPWGMEVAPRNFGKFSGDLLIGNFGDGRINAFDRRTGRFEGTLEDPSGNPISIPGLWGLQRGTDRVGGHAALWFAAGINDEQNGLLGLLRARR